MEAQVKEAVSNVLQLMTPEQMVIPASPLNIDNGKEFGIIYVLDMF